MVFRLAGNGSEDVRAEEVAIEIQSLLGERVAVRGSLGAGDEVITEGHFGLIDGDPVEVRR